MEGAQEAAVMAEKPEPAALPGFGVWLGLLAITLTLSAVRGVAGVLTINTGPQPGNSVEVGLDLLVGLVCMVALALLLKRKRAFIPVMIAIMVVNFVSGIWYAVWEGMDAPAIVTLVVSVLWISYLLRSKHARKVCVN